VPSSAAARPRLTVGAVVTSTAAAAVAAALAAGPLLAQPADDPLRPLTTVLAILGLAATAVGLAVRAPSWTIAGAGLFGAEVVSTLFERGPRIDAWTPVVATGLLVLCELAAWSAEARDGALVTPADGPRLPRAAVLGLVAIGAWVAVTGLAELTVTVARGRDLVVAAIGALAMAGLAAALLTLSRLRAQP
jgi:hypothetical protein